MNWTGGRLQRHSNRNTLTHRQKQHFAKVRTQHRNASGDSSPPFRPHYVPPHETEEEALGAPFGRRAPIKRHQALDQHATPVHLVQRLPSMKPRPVRRPSTQPSPRSSPTHRHISPWTIHGPSKASGRSLSLLHQGDLIISPTAVVSSPKTENGQELSCQREYAGQKHQAKKKSDLDGTIKDDMVEHERSRLLARRDWAGLSPSRPLRMQFPSVGEREIIGKRHTSCSNKVRKTNGGGATQAPFLTRIHADLGGPWMSGAPVNHDDNIVIKIGPDALTTQPPAQGNDSHMPECRLTPSDAMLFDMEDAVQELQPIRPGKRSMEREKEETQNINLPDAERGLQETRTYTEAEPVEDVERLLQELDECPCRAPATPASKAYALLASAYECSGNYEQGRIRVSNTRKEELTPCPISLQEVESGGESSSLDRAETCVQTEGQPELQSAPPKPSWLLSKYSSTEPSAQGLHCNLAWASNGPQSKSSLELIDCPSSLEEGFDDIRRLEVQGCALDRTDQYSVARQTGSERQMPCRGIREDREPSTAPHDSSADRAARLRLSAELPINIYAGHCANAWGRRVKRSQPTDRSPNSEFSSEREAANTFRRSCSDTLHSQASESAPDIRSAESPSGSRCQITMQAEGIPAAPAQGWIGDADGGVKGEDAEAVWRRFVFGENDRTTIDNAHEEHQSPEPGVRSTPTPGWSTTSSLWVETSSNSAAAGTSTMSPARTHLHSVGIRAGTDDTTDASAGRAMTSGEEQASKSMAFVEEGNTTAMASPKDNRRLPVRIHDADAQANQTSTDANTVAATAGESSGELAGLGRRERIIFTKPKAFVGSMAVAGPAVAEGNNAPKGMSHTGSAGKISDSRERRRRQRTTRFSPLFYRIPSRTGYAPDLIEDA